MPVVLILFVCINAYFLFIFARVIKYCSFLVKDSKAWAFDIPLSNNNISSFSIFVALMACTSAIFSLESDCWLQNLTLDGIEFLTLHLF